MEPKREARARPFQFSLRTLLLAVSVVALLMGLLLAPVARINQEACDRIRPGMTEREAEEIVGASPGWYDGVGGISTNAPGWKGHKPYWVGMRGEIVLNLDEAGRVVNATYYPGTVLDWSLGQFLWERLARRGEPAGGLSLPERVGVFVTAIVLVTLCIGVMAVRADGVNSVANHGGLGLLVGSAAGGVVFYDMVFSDVAAASLVLSAPFVGAIVGVFIGLSRKVRTRRSRSA